MVFSPGAVLRAAVVALSVKRGGVDASPKHGQQLVVFHCAGENTHGARLLSSKGVVIKETGQKRGR